MKTTIVLLTLAIVLFVAVSPVFADTGTVKPVCNAGNTWLDKLFGKCIEIKTNTTSTGNAISSTMINSNPVYDNVPAVKCDALNIYGNAGHCK